MNWIKENLGTSITIALLIVSMIVQWVRFESAAELAHETANRLRLHEMDSSIHVDRNRDERRWDDLIRRLDRMEGKIDGK